MACPSMTSSSRNENDDPKEMVELFRHNSYKKDARNKGELLMDMLWDLTEQPTKQMRKASESSNEELSSAYWLPMSFVCDVCRNVVNENAMLAHFLYNHDLQKSSCLLETQYEEWNVTILSLKRLQLHEPVCLEVCTIPDPSLRSPILNQHLKGVDLKMKGHLPVAIMCCLTSWSHLKPFNNYKARRADLITSPNYQILIVWVVAARTKTPLRATVTLRNEDFTREKRQVLRAFSMGYYQLLDVFSGTDCIMLTKKELTEWTKGIRSDKLINVEFSVHDDAS